MFKHILIPTDGSTLSRRAVRIGIRLAQATGARVTGFFAAPPATPIIYRRHLPVGYATPEAHAAAIDRAAASYLGQIEREARKAGVRVATVRTTSDYPADAILAAAARGGCDLIVMASHGRRGLAGLLLGSETQKVLARARIPVMVVR
jgi:nucleotide-binding universal stress UspA family protein